MVDAGRVLGGGQDRVGLGGGAVGVGGREGASGGGALVGRGGAGLAGGEHGGGLVDVLDVDRHGDRVGVGPVGDLDHDGAGVGVVAGAAACVLVVGRDLEGQDAAAGDAEQVVVDAGRVLFGGQDRVGLGGGAVGVGGHVGPDRLLVLVGRGGGRVPVAELGRELVDVLDGDGDRLGDRVGAGVGGGDDDHVLVVGARVAGRLVVRAGGGREPEGGAAVDLEQLAVGAAGDGEGGRVAGIGVGRGEREDVFVRSR